MLSVTGLGKSFGARVLFEDVSLQLNPGSRYGLVGANGSGKTTFLRILAGDEPASEGSFVVKKGARLGALRQDLYLEDRELILELAMRGDAVVWNALREQRLAEAGDHPDPTRLADLADVIAAHDGYTLEARASEVLEGLGIATRYHRAPLSTLSGGFKLRVLLAQVLMAGADLLLLDEPTNHLDILSIRWLEKFLGAYAGCALIISHDQRFLDNVTTHTLDVDYRTITLYTGNYARFVVDKAETRERRETTIARAEEEIARKRAFVERFGAKNTKATQAQSRLKQIEKIAADVEELAPSSRRSPILRIAARRPSGRDVVTVEGISRSFGEKKVLTDVSLRVGRGERVAIIGPNGLGKSTLLKILVGRLAADAGDVKWGHETHVGYFPQDHREVLADEEATPLDTLWALCPAEGVAWVRGQLGRVLFSADDVERKIGSLSGGEAARLIFALLVVQKPNVLVLDEPTNHLDLEAIQAMVEALQAYDGTVIFVSHNRWFVSELASRIVEVTAQGPRDFPGSYADYLERCGDDHLDADTVVQEARRARQKAAETAGAAASAAASEAAWQEQKRRRNRLSQLPARRDRVLAAIEAAEARKREITELYCTPGFFERTSREELAALEKEQADLDPRIESLMAEWETLEQEIATLEG